jgi:hypothetical protein
MARMDLNENCGKEGEVYAVLMESRNGEKVVVVKTGMKKEGRTEKKSAREKK